MSTQTDDTVAEGVQRRGPRSFKARTWRGGPTKTFPTKREAVAWRRDAMGKRGRPVITTGSTVADECTAWLAALEPYAIDSTYRIYADRIRLMVLPHLGERRCDQLTKTEVEAWAAALVRHPYAVVTVNQTVRLLATVLDAAIDENRLDGANPARRARKVPSPPTEAIAAPDADAVAAIMAALPNRSRIVAQLALGAGLRASEAFAVTPDDIVGNRLTVRRQWRQHKVGGRAWYAFANVKGRHRRTIPIPASLAMAVRAHVAAFGLSTAGTVASLANGSPMISQQWNLEWARARTATGVSLRGVHWLRHAYATGQLAAGRSVADVSLWLGHASPVTTWRTYVHHDAMAEPADLLARTPVLPVARQSRPIRALSVVPDTEKVL